MDAQNDTLYPVSEQPVMVEQAAAGTRATCAADAQACSSKRVSHRAPISKVALNYFSLEDL